MRLVVDASTLVAEGLRTRGRRLIADPKFDLFFAAEAWSETQHEVRKRVALLVDRGHLLVESGSQLLDEALAAISQAVTIVPTSVYANRLQEAIRRIPRDDRDAPTVALSLVLGCGIWTGDRDFFGCGVAIWSTETLGLHITMNGHNESPGNSETVT